MRKTKCLVWLYYWLRTWFSIDFPEANQRQKTCRCDRHVKGPYCNPKNFTCVTRGACIVFLNELQNGSYIQERSCSTDTSSKFLCGDPTRKHKVHCCYSDMCNADIHLPLPSPTSGPDGGKVSLCSFSAALKPNPWIQLAKVLWSRCDNVVHSSIRDGENFCSSFQNSYSRVPFQKAFSAFLPLIIIFQIVSGKWKDQ